MSIEAMKQALEALQEITGVRLTFRQSEAITALHQAIEQAEKQEPVAYLYHDTACAELANPLADSTLLVLACDRKPNGKNETPLYTAPPQAERQEPDAWLSGEGLELKQVFVKQNGDWTELPFSIGRPRKELVGLTDDDIQSLEHKHLMQGVEFEDQNGYWAVYRAIEAKLKEKNGGS